MQTSDKPITISSSTLKTLVIELGEECKNVITLISQLQLPSLTVEQQAEILAELLTSTVHLHTHCGEEFQALIFSELEKLPDSQ